MRTSTAIVVLGFGFALFGLVALTSPAQASNVDFFCNLLAPTNCTGTASGSGTNWTTSGLGFYQDQGPQPPDTLFTLTFNTGVNTQLTLTGPGSEILQGNYSSFSATTGASTTLLSFAGVDWTTLPADFQAFLGSSTGRDSGFAILAGTSCATGCANQSGDILITPVPEPSSLSLLGLGLLLPGGGFAFVRRRFKK